MKRRYMLTISVFSIIAGSMMLNQHTLQARSETAREMEEGTARGEEAAGPVGAVVGGLLGGATGLVKDTGDAVTGDRVIVDEYEDDILPRTYDDEYIYEDVYTNGRSETAKEMAKGAASGENLLGPVGAVAGGIVGAGVGLAKDTDEAITGRNYGEEEVIIGPSEREVFITEEDMDLIPRDISPMDNTLTIDEVE